MGSSLVLVISDGKSMEKDSLISLTSLNTSLYILVWRFMNVKSVEKGLLSNMVSLSISAYMVVSRIVCEKY